jgi:hypothetical protein
MRSAPLLRETLQSCWPIVGRSQHSILINDVNDILPDPESGNSTDRLLAHCRTISDRSYSSETFTMATRMELLDAPLS